MNTIWLLHGIHTPMGDPKVLRLVPYLAQLKVEIKYPDYGYVAAIETRRINPALWGMLTPCIESGDVLVGHSNGGCVAYETILNLPPTVVDIGLVLIDAALRRDITLPPNVKWCQVYYNAGDQVTQLAALAELVPFSLVDQNWGSMGHAGYSGDDPKVDQIDCAHTKGLMNDLGHSEIFVPPEINQWGPYITTNIGTKQWPTTFQKGQL